jgi:hypothetical protein
MNIEQIEKRFHELKGQKEAGEIDDEQFAAELEKLQFRDEQGQLWMIGASTGKWYYYEEEESRWVRGEPPRESEVPSKAAATKASVSPAMTLPAKLSLLLLSKRGLLLTVGALVVIVLIIAGILASREWFPGTVTPPAVALVTKIATPSSTETPTQMPTDTPSSTATSTQAPTDAPSPPPTATVTFTPTPTDTPTTVVPTPTDTPTATVPPTVADTVTPTHTPTVAGRIAFPVFDPTRETYDIFVANADGTGRTKIKEEASQPCLSPDGTEITYRSWRSDTRGLIVAHTFGGDIWTITTRHEASRPSVSRGGTVYHVRQAPGPEYIYLLRGGKEPKVIEWGDQLQAISGESPAWVSGERLVYKGCVGANCGLYLTDGVYDGTGLTQLTYETADTNPEASPDGKQVTFMSRRDGNWEVYVMDLDTRKVKRLTTNEANDGLPIWSPDGRTIAFASDRSGEWAAWAMNPDGSNQRVLFPLGGSLHGYVQDAPLHERGGWEEERLSWGP